MTRRCRHVQPAVPSECSTCRPAAGGGLVSGDDSRDMLDAVVAAVDALGDAELVVKVHPRDASKVFDGLDGSLVASRGPATWSTPSSPPTPSWRRRARRGWRRAPSAGPCSCSPSPGSRCSPPTPAPRRCRAGHRRPGGDRGPAGDPRRNARATWRHLTTGRRSLVDDLFAGLEPGAAARVAEALLRPAATSSAAPS